MSWQRRDSVLYSEESSVIRRRLPDVMIREHEGKVVLEGQFPVYDSQRSVIRKYLLGVVFPGDYPDWIPRVVMLEPGVEWIADRHIFTRGTACLCLPHEIPSYLPDSIRFEPFLDRLVNPWLLGQAFYDRNGRWPWPDRSHGKKGILEGFSDLLGIDDLATVERYAKLLVRKHPAKGHERCPCGSGKALRHCHSAFYHQYRRALPRRAMRVYRKAFARDSSRV